VDKIINYSKKEKRKERKGTSNSPPRNTNGKSIINKKYEIKQAQMVFRGVIQVI
jgi:hypothetical protein